MADTQIPNHSAEPEREKISTRRGQLTLLGLLSILAVLLIVTLVDRERTVERNLGEDMCPLDAEEIVASTALLVDLSKPLYDASLVSGLLGTVSRNLGKDEELRVYTIVAPTAGAASGTDSTRLLGRLCKPYDNADLLFGPSKDQRGAWRDCDDLPAQLPLALRNLAGHFCVVRSNLQSDIDKLAVQNESSPDVPGVALIEGLRSIRAALSERSAPRTLYVFSDMLQHASWYSHFDLNWTQWSGADYLAESIGSPQFQAENLWVSILYVPRQRITEPLRLRNAHQQFWRSFFQGADVQFEDLPVKPFYAVQRLMPLPSDNDSEDREEVDRLSAETEQLREKLEEAQRKLQDIRQQPSATDSNQDGSTSEASESEPSASVQAAQEERPSLDAEETGAALAAPTPAPAAVPTTTEASETTPNTALPANPTDAASLPPSPPVSDAAAIDAAESNLSMSSAPAIACTVNLKPRFLDQPYPSDRSVDYGDGTMIVDFLLDENGSTVDAEVVWRREESSSTQPRSIDALATDTVSAVRAWEFDFSSSSACEMRQRRRATFTYRRRCVGAPVPSCRTVRTGLSILSPSSP